MSELAVSELEDALSWYVRQDVWHVRQDVWRIRKGFWSTKHRMVIGSGPNGLQDCWTAELAHSTKTSTVRFCTAVEAMLYAYKQWRKGKAKHES